MLDQVESPFVNYVKTKVISQRIVKHNSINTDINSINGITLIEDIIILIAKGNIIIVPQNTKGNIDGKIIINKTQNK